MDYLHGFMDIHNHILPGIDDGAKTPEESVAMIQAFAGFGVKNFVFTPHIMNHYHPNTPKSIKDAFELLKGVLEKQGVGDIKIDFAAEHMIDDEFESLMDQDRIVPLKKEYMLIEMSYLQASFSFDYAVKKIQEHGYFPILAHPERYNYYHQDPKIYTELRSDGIQFQLNLLSLSGYYGSEIQKMALKLINEGMIDYCASDAHNLKHLDAIKEIKLSQKTLNQVLPIIENTIQTFY